MDDALAAMARAEEANARFRRVDVGPDVVTRPANATTATVHSLLYHLRKAGLDCVPEPLGIRDDVETLRLIDGESGGQGWYHQHTDQGLASAARLLRTIHDAALKWAPAADAVWGMPAVPGHDLVYCHGDPGPWNFIWRDGEAVALVDWDYLHPAPRTDDVAYALHWFAPLRTDEMTLDWHHFPAVPDRRHRTEVLLAAYGDLPGFDLVEAVTQRLLATRDLMRSLAEQGQEPQRTWVADGALRHADEEVRWLRQHRNLFT